MRNVTRSVGNGSLLPVAKPCKQKNRKSSPARKPAAPPPEPSKFYTSAVLNGLAAGSHLGGGADARWLRELLGFKLPVILGALNALASRGEIVKQHDAADQKEIKWKVPVPVVNFPPAIPAIPAADLLIDRIGLLYTEGAETTAEAFTVQVIRPARKDRASGLQWSCNLEGPPKPGARDFLFVSLAPGEPHEVILNGQPVRRFEGDGWQDVQRSTMTIRGVSTAEMLSLLSVVYFSPVNRTPGATLVLPIITGNAFEVHLDGRLVVNHTSRKGGQD